MSVCTFSDCVAVWHSSRSSSRLLDHALFDNVRGWTPTPAAEEVRELFLNDLFICELER